MESRGAAEGGPTLDPDVEAVRAHEGQLATCAADGESHVADGGHGSETTTTRRADAGAPTPTTTVPTRPGDADEDEGGAGGTGGTQSRASRRTGDRGCRLQKYAGSAAIPGSMTTMSAPTITRVKVKARVGGFEMPDESDGFGCVFLFILFPSRKVHVLISWFGAQGS